MFVGLDGNVCLAQRHLMLAPGREWRPVWARRCPAGLVLVRFGKATPAASTAEVYLAGGGRP